MKRKIPDNPQLDEYFKLSTSPMKGSPVGRLMQAIVAESPGIDFEDARKMAHEGINKTKRKSELRN